MYLDKENLRKQKHFQYMSKILRKLVRSNVTLYGFFLFGLKLCETSASQACVVKLKANEVLQYLEEFAFKHLNKM